MSALIPWEDALRSDLSRLEPPASAQRPLEECLGLALAEPVVAPEAAPPFDNSAMDGFAVRVSDVAGASADNPVTLPMGERLPAGAVSLQELPRGYAARIMTGAPLPQGAEAVIPVEHTDAWDPETGRIRADLGDAVMFYRGAKAGNHIRRAGESVAKGARVLDRGHVLGAAELALLMSLGIRLVNTYSLPRVAVLSTGDELVPWTNTPGPGQIRDSNRPGLLAFLTRLGLPTKDLGLAPDDPQALEQSIRANLEHFDYLLTSGGVSVGERDFTRDVLGRLGSVTARKVAMKPGKPQVVGNLQGKPVFGLPGNPVSSLVVFEVFVLPALRTLAGHARAVPRRFDAELTTGVKHALGRTEFLRVRLIPREGRWTAEPTGPQGSGILTSMTMHNGYAMLPADSGDLSAGDTVACMASAAAFDLPA